MRPLQRSLLHAANGVTLTGLLLALLVVVLAARGSVHGAFAALVGAGLCDLFDGFIARRLTLSEHAAAHRSLALMQLDMELFPFQADFMALDSAARREAWCARVPDANRMPGWCSEGVISQFQQPMEVPR